MKSTTGGAGTGGGRDREAGDVEYLLGAQRGELISTLQRLGFGKRVTFELNGGERVAGRLRGCDGVRAVLISGTVVQVAAIKRVVIGE